MDIEEQVQEPKYWDKERHSVVNGVERKKTPIRLNDLCGTYHWVWNGDCNFPEEIGPSSDLYDEWGCITLKATNPSGRLTVRNISGAYRMCRYRWRFKNLENEKDPNTNRRIPNSWKAKDVELEADEADEFRPADDQLFSVSKVLDDNNHPFLVVGVMGVTDVHCAIIVDESIPDYEMIAKKQRTDFVEGELWEGLTDDECNRLGMHLSDEEVKEMAGETEDDDHITEADRFEADDKKPAIIKRKAGREDNIQAEPPKKLKSEEAE